MDRRIAGSARLALGVVLVAGLAAGCAQPQAAIRYAVGKPDETIAYDSATFQAARNRKVQIILYRRLAAPIGEGDPDFEYVFLEIPDGAKYGWVKEDNVPAYRWVRQNKKDEVWQGTAGQVSLRFADRARHLHLDFRITMEPLTQGGTGHIMSGKVACAEDPARTQGLINQYGGWLASILGLPQQPSEGKRPTLKLPGKGASGKKAPGQTK